MKINFTILAVLLFFMPMTSNAMTAENNMYENNETAKPTHFILCLNSGEQITFVIENEPKIVNFEDMIRVIENGFSTEYPLADVHKYMMGEDTPTGITTSEEPEGSIKNEVGTIILSGFKAGAPVTISNMNGMVVYKSEIGTDGSLYIRTSQYSEGVYILKVQNKTLKFTRR